MQLIDGLILELVSTASFQAMSRWHCFSCQYINSFMDDKKQQQDLDTGDLKREQDKNKTVNDPGSNVVDYGRSEQVEVEKSRGERNLGKDSDRNKSESIY
jgi:hypothetical protein